MLGLHNEALAEINECADNNVGKNAERRCSGVSEKEERLGDGSSNLGCGMGLRNGLTIERNNGGVDLGKTLGLVNDFEAQRRDGAGLSSFRGQVNEENNFSPRNKDKDEIRERHKNGEDEVTDLAAEVNPTDPFNLFPLINSIVQPKRKKPKMKSLESIFQSARRIESRSELRSCDLGVGSTVGGGSVEGVERRLKRGRRCKSVAAEMGLDSISISGEVNLKDQEIEACNNLILRRNEVHVNEVWRVGNVLGVLLESNKDEVLQKFAEWDLRDGKIGNRKEAESIVERPLVLNEDC